MSRMSIPTLFIAGLVVLILVAFACTYQVAFNQVAVKVRFGKADASSIIREPGLKLRWPWPIESIETYDTRVRTLDTPETEIKTSDGKNLIVGAYAVWAIADPLHFYKRVRSAGEAEKQMRSRLSQSQAAVIGQSTLADFVNLDGAEGRQLRPDAGPDAGRRGTRPRGGLRDQTRSRGHSPRLPAQRGHAAGLCQHAAGAEQAGGPLPARGQVEGRGHQGPGRVERQADSGVRRAQVQGDRVRGHPGQHAHPGDDPEGGPRLLRVAAVAGRVAGGAVQKTTIFLDEKSPFFEPFVHPPVPPEPQKP